MARLGKRERKAKRDLIKVNLNSPRQSTPRAMRSYLDTDNMLGRTHAGFRNPQNARGSEDTSQASVRFIGQPRLIDDIKGPTRKVTHLDTRRLAALKMELRKANAK